MQQYEEINKLVKWCSEHFKDCCDYFLINKVSISVRTLLRNNSTISQQVCDEIIDAHTGSYDIFMRGDPFNLWSGCTINIAKSIPCDNVTFTVDENTSSIHLNFVADGIHFPDHALFNKTGKFTQYSITNHTFRDLASVPSIKTDNLFFMMCTFPNDSLNGLTFSKFTNLHIEHSDVANFGNGFSNISDDFQLALLANDIKLRSWAGLPSSMSGLVLGTYPDSDGPDAYAIDGPVAITYDPKLVQTLPNYLKRCSSITWPFCATAPISVLNLLLIECDELFLHFSQDAASRQVATIVANQFSERKHNHKDLTSFLLDCQEELIEMGFSKYAKL